MPDPANEAICTRHRQWLVRTSARRHGHSIWRRIIDSKALAAPVPSRSTGSADRQLDQPKAQIPITHRVRPAGSCMLGFRTLKRPKSFDKAAVRAIARLR
jgi:hypothetical protein